jgi:hypothetical protein
MTSLETGMLRPVAAHDRIDVDAFTHAATATLAAHPKPRLPDAAPRRLAKRGSHP